jgi:hypothetical protein
MTNSQLAEDCVLSRAAGTSGAAVEALGCDLVGTRFRQSAGEARWQRQSARHIPLEKESRQSARAPHA